MVEASGITSTHEGELPSPFVVITPSDDIAGLDCTYSTPGKCICEVIPFIAPSLCFLNHEPNFTLLSVVYRSSNPVWKDSSTASFSFRLRDPGLIKFSLQGMVLFETRGTSSPLPSTLCNATCV